MSAEGADSQPAVLFARYGVYFALGCVLALCALLRMYGLSQEALTTDEYVTYIFDGGASLQEYTALNRFRLPDSLPGYFTAYWLWVQIAGTSIFASRLFSVLCGLGSCMLLFFIVRKAYHPWAGVLASAAYAVSPFYLYHDQAIRPYALFTFLSGVSILTTLYMAEGTSRRGWFALNIAANVLLVYTHLLGAILIAVEGLFLLVVWRHRIPRLACWTVALGMLCLPALLFVYIPEQDPRYLLPDLDRIFANYFATDSVRLNVELMPSQRNLVWHPNLLEIVTAYDPGMSVALGLVAMAALLLTPLLVWLRPREGASRQEGPVLRDSLFLAMVLFVPILLLSALSLVTEPIPLPRYNIYTVFGRLALVSGLVMYLPGRLLRIAAAAGFLGIVSWQLLWMLPAGARTEFIAAAKLMQDERPPPTRILATMYPDNFYVHFPMTGNLDSVIHEPMAFHLAPDYEVEPGYSLVAMTQAVEESLPPLQLREQEAERPHVFLVFIRLFEHEPIAQLEALLDAHGLGYGRTHYQGYEGLTVYRVWRRRPMTAAPDERHFNLPRFVSEWRLEAPDDEDFERSLAHAMSLRLDQQPRPPAYASEYSAVAFILGSVSTNIALRVVEAGLREYPHSVELELALGTFLLLEGREAEAHDAWKRTLERAQPAITKSLGGMLQLAIDGNYAEGLERFQRLQAISGGIFEPLLAEALAKAAR